MSDGSDNSAGSASPDRSAPPNSSVGARRDPLGIGFWLLFIAAGIWLRVTGIGSMPLYGDEYHTLGTLEMSYGEILRLFDPVGSHVALPLIQKVCADLFGGGIVTNRLVALVPGILALLLLYPLGRPLVGGPAALVATAALALSPMHIFYSRFGRGYALSLLLSLLLVDAIRRATQAEPGRAFRHWLSAALWVALLPYVHLTSAGLIAAVGLAAAWITWRQRGPRGVAAPVLAFAAGGVLSALMFLPALDTLLVYLGKIKGEGFTEAMLPLDVPTILAGGRAAGIVFVIGVPIAVILLAFKDLKSAALCLAPIVGPLVSTVVFKPNGMAYAYARYLHVGLPFILLLLGWLLSRIVRADRPTALVGAALVLVGFWLGPRSPQHHGNGPYDNTYLAMKRLPAFDEPFIETSQFYRDLAEDDSVTKIIEAPPMGSRSILLYRNYYLQHDKQTVFGLLTPSRETLVHGPYVRVFDKELDQSTGAQILIIHNDVAYETARYWSFVYNFVWSRDRREEDASFMIRHGIYLDPPGPIDPKMLRPINRRFGRPIYEDEFIRVYDLRTRVDGARGAASGDAGSDD